MSESASIQAEYNAKGYVRIRRCLPTSLLERYQQEIRAVVVRVGAAHGLSLAGEASLDAAFNALCDADRGYGAMVYDCMRYHPLMQELAHDPRIVDVARSLLNPRLLYHVHDQLHFRIDRRDEGRFALPWHQDYWYNNTTTDAVTVWVPLVDVPIAKGPVRFLDGSHRDVAPVLVDENFRERWDQNRLFTLADPVNDEDGTDVPTELGDVVFLHALALHRSGVNQLRENRFTAVLRFSDLLSAELVGKRWKTGIQVGRVSLLDQRPDVIRNLSRVKGEGR